MAKKVIFNPFDSRFQWIDIEDLSPYAKLDGSNQPFTGDLSITKTAPVLKLTDETNEYAKLARLSTSNAFDLTNRSLKPGSATAFDYENGGQAKFGSTKTTDNVTTGFSISCWVKFGSVPPSSSAGFFGSEWTAGRRKFIMFTTSNGYFQLMIRNAADSVNRSWVSTTAVINQTDVWYHIVIRTDFAGNRQLFVNGSKYDTNNVGGAPADMTNAASDWIVGRPTTTGTYPDCSIQYIEFYQNYQLSDGEVAALYNSGAGKATTGTETGLTWYIPCNEGTGTSHSFYVVGGSTYTMNHTGTTAWVTGTVGGAPSVVESDIIQTIDGAVDGEKCITTFGDDEGRTLVDGNSLRLQVSGVEQVRVDDGTILPTTDDDIDLGSSAKRFKDGYFSGDVAIDTDLDVDGIAYIDTIKQEDSEKHYFGTADDMDIYYDGTNGYIHTDLVAASDLKIDCGTEKTIELQTVTWDDIRITPGNFDRPDVSDPNYVVYYPNDGGLGTYLTEWAKDDFASFTVQIPHAYKEGENIYIHAHWTAGSNGLTESGNTVGWKVDYAWANIDGTFGDMQTADLSDACDGTDHKHQMTPEVSITGTSKTISSMLVCNIRRSDTGTDDTWTGTSSGELPLLLEIDFHFPINTLGSRTRYVK